MEEKFQEIFNRVRENKATQEDLDALELLFGDPSMEYEIKNALYAQLEATEQEPSQGVDFEKMYNRLWFRIQKNEQKIKSIRGNVLWRKFGQVAAILVVGLLIGLLLSPLKDKSEAVYCSTVAPKGSISKLYLPDSTLIYLNAGSSIKYCTDQTQDKREVYLSGEAWFDVRKDAEHPFVVHTPYYKVKVLGTEFNVRAYKDDQEITTTLEKGRIEILSGENFKLHKPIDIRPGEQISYNKKDRKINVKRVNSSLYSSWKDNKLIFVNKNFKELIDILERKYGVEIQVVDTTIYRYHFDGTIKDESIFEMLDLIKTTLPIQYHIDDQTIIIEKNRLPN